MPNFNLPHTFHDGTNETASGAQVSEDLQLLKEKIETLENLQASYLKLSAGATFAATVERVFGTEYEPSSTRPTLVVVSVAFAGKTGEHGIATVWAGAVQLNELNLASIESTGVSAYCTFILPPGGKFHVNGGLNAYKVFSNYLTL